MARLSAAEDKKARKKTYEEIITKITTCSGITITQTEIEAIIKKAASMSMSDVAWRVQELLVSVLAAINDRRAASGMKPFHDVATMSIDSYSTRAIAQIIASKNDKAFIHQIVSNYDPDEAYYLKHMRTVVEQLSSNSSKCDLLEQLPTFMQRQILAFFTSMDYALASRSCTYMHAHWMQALEKGLVLNFHFDSVDLRLNLLNYDPSEFGGDVDIGQVQKPNNIRDATVCEFAEGSASDVSVDKNVVGEKSCAKIMDKIKEMDKLNDVNDVTDYKAVLSMDEVKNLLLESEWQSLATLMKRSGMQCNKIMVRCWVADGKCIRLHLDHHKKVMQVVLNGAGDRKGDHQGGLLFYCFDDVVVTPERVAGMVYTHNNTVAHGVTPLTGGKRFGLYFLQD